MDEQSIFLEALEKDTAEARAAWLADACGTNHELRARIEALIQRHGEVHSFLERPPAEYQATLVPEAMSQNRADALEGGLVVAFAEHEAIVLGSAAHSVLGTLGASMDVPRVALRESAAETIDPVVRPRSKEMPQADSDSRFQLQGEIARGGMGAILKGRDTDLGRDLAIKVLLDQHKDKPQVIQRFIEEAQIGGQLQHPGIAPIYELGQFADKRPFFAMKLVKGETLSKLLADRTEPSVERGRFIGIFEQVCQTMAYAHSRGVIHRDLKPANIMVGAFGEVQVMDWGLAKVLAAGGIADEAKSHQQQTGQSIVQTLRSMGGDTPGTFGTVGSHTQMGSIMGTPAYMPPEQALGEIDQLDERADVFGLGAILCEILTGKPPYVGEDGTQVFRMASRGKLQDCLERLDRCGADSELTALAKQCLELEPANRPRDAGVLAERVSRYIESVESKLRHSETEAAVRAERLEQQQRSARKLHTLIAGLVVVSCFTIGTTVVAGKFWNDAEISRRNAETSQIAATKQANRANEQRDLAEQNLAKADRAEKEALKERNAAQQAQLDALDQTYLATLNEIRAMRFARQSGWRSAALDRIHKLNRLGSRNLDQVELRTEALACLAEMDARIQSTFKSTIESQPFNAWRLEFSPDGDALAIAANNSVFLHDVVTQQQLRSIPSEIQLSLFAFHPSGTLAVPTAKDRVTYHALKPGQPIFPEIAGEGIVRNLAFSKSGDRVAVGWSDSVTLREAIVYETATGKSLWKIECPERPGGLYKTPLALSPDGQTLATIGPNNEVRLYSEGSSQSPVILGRLDNRLCAMAFDPQGKHLVAAGLLVGAVWELQNKSELFRIHAPEGGFWDVKFSPDGQLIGGVANDLTARLWDARSGRELVTVPTATGDNSLSFAFSPRGDRFAAGGPLASIMEIEGRGERRVDQSISNLVHGLAFHKQQATLFASGGDSRVHNVKLNEMVPSPFRNIGRRPNILKLSADGRYLAQGFGNWTGGNNQDFSITVWSVDSSRQERSFEGPQQSVDQIAFDPTSHLLAASSGDGRLYVWDVDTGVLKKQIDLRCNAIQFIDESHLIVTTEQQVLVIRANDGTALRQLNIPTSPIALVITPDNQEALVADRNGHIHRVRISDLNVVQSATLFEQPGHRCIAISADGRLLAMTTNWGRGHFLIDAHTLKPLARLPEHDSRLACIEFDSTGEYFAMGGSQLALWNLDLVRVELARLGLEFGELKLDETVARFAKAFEHTSNQGAKARILAAATSVPGLLEKLAERTTGDAQFHLDLSRLLAEQAKTELADAHRSLATGLFRQRLQQEPNDSALAGELADLLLPPLDRQDVVPTSEQSGVQWRYSLAQPGETWSESDFDDSAWMTSCGPFGSPERKGIRTNWSSSDIWIRHRFELQDVGSRETHYLVRLRYDDIAEVFLNGTLIAQRSGYTEERYLEIDLEATIGELLHPGRNTLAVHCHNVHGPGDIDAGLIAVRDTTRSRAKQRSVASRLTDPWGKLAAAYQILGDRTGLDNLLEDHSAASVGVGSIYAEDGDWQRALDVYRKVITSETTDPQLFAKRAEAYGKLNQWSLAQADWRQVVALRPDQLQTAFDELKRASRWNEAVEFGLELIKQKPDDTLQWLSIAPVLVQADDQSIYADFCSRLVQRFAESDSPIQADQIVKACLLRANAIDLAKLPSSKLGRYLDETQPQAQGVIESWAWGSRALLALRSNDPESTLKFVTKSEGLTPPPRAHLLNLSLLAIAHHELKHPAEARQALAEASRLLQNMQFDPGTRINHDAQIAQILFREAEVLINGEAK